jgi:hypothetical protein
MAYVLNNIRFRSVSSKALERYYNSKSFILNELIDERKQFSQVAREIQLLFFNTYSDWASKVESLLLNRSKVDESDIKIIFQRFGEVVESNKQIFAIHSDVFRPDFLKVFAAVHKHIPQSFKRRVRENIGISQLEAYPLIIDALVAALQRTLYELYEIDCLLGSNLVAQKVTSNASQQDHIITYIGRDDLRDYRETGSFIAKHRLTHYLENVVLPNIVIPVKVRNYTEEFVELKNGVVVGAQPISRLLTDLQENPRIKIVEITS